MRPTGIVRRIDELGRVVIPREIRCRFKIKEGDPLEMWGTDEGIVLKPYEDEQTREGSTLLKELEQEKVEGLTSAELVALRALLGRYLEIKKGEI